jgi:hypothetical protein
MQADCSARGAEGECVPTRSFGRKVRCGIKPLASSLFIPLLPVTPSGLATALAGYRSGKEILFSLRVPTHSGAAEQGVHIDFNAR